VISTSVRVGHPKANVAIRVYYESTEELQSILEKIRGMPLVRDVEWSEEVRVLDKEQDAVLREVFFQNPDTSQKKS
jgi:hypothetical protein